MPTGDRRWRDRRTRLRPVSRWAVGILAAGLAGLAGGTASGGELPRFVVAHGFGEDHPVHGGVVRFRERLAPVAAVEVHPETDDAEIVRALLAGRVAAAVIAPAALRDVVREVTLLDLMGLWRDRGHWGRSLDGDPGRHLAARVERGSASGGGAARLLGYWGGTRRHLLTRREGVPTVEALGALRLGIPINPVRSKMWKAVGVRPVLLPQGEIPGALRDGTVDALEAPADAIVRARLFEAASHLTETGHAIATRLLVVGEGAWRGLTRAHQEAVIRAAQDATAAARALEADREAQALASLRERFGVTLHPFPGRDALMRRTQPLRRRYAEELGVLPLLALIERAAAP